MKSTQTWQSYEIYVSNGSDYSPQAFRQAARKLCRTVVEHLSAPSQPPFNPEIESQHRRQIIDPLTGLTIPAMFY
ncbi:MAG: hypothetical protein ACFCVB_07295 [Nodosilinea sp.]